MKSTLYANATVAPVSDKLLSGGCISGNSDCAALVPGETRDRCCEMTLTSCSDSYRKLLALMTGKCQFCSSRDQPPEFCAVLGEHPEQFTLSASATSRMQASPVLLRFLVWRNCDGPDSPTLAVMPDSEVRAYKVADK